MYKGVKILFYFKICIDEAIKMLFATLDSTFGGMKRTVKMHLLEDHMVDWLSKHQAGCGCRVDSC